MPISARTRPTVTLVGPIESARPIQKKENGQPVGEVLGHNLAIDTEGGRLFATAWAREFPSVPAAGTVVGVVAAVSEDSRGAQLTALRFASKTDLEALASAVGIN